MKDVVIAIDRVFKFFRTGFLGKASPVHLFWGSFDLAVTRFDRSDGCSGSARRTALTTAPQRLWRPID